MAFFMRSTNCAAIYFVIALSRYVRAQVSPSPGAHALPIISPNATESAFERGVERRVGSLYRFGISLTTLVPELRNSIHQSTEGPTSTAQSLGIGKRYPEERNITGTSGSTVEPRDAQA